MQSKNKTPLKGLLEQLGFNSKESEVYLLLLELGSRPAAALARKLNYPKSTILFLCDNLVKRGYVRRSMRGKTQFFFADPKDLEEAQKAEIKVRESALTSTIPLLHELKNPFSAEPKVNFFTGVDGCRRAYLQNLNSSTEILEFGIQKDLVTKLGASFMNKFIRERVKRKIPLRAIANVNDIDKQLQKRDHKELRAHRFFDQSYGHTYSSIAVYDNKVLLLNLHHDVFGILIENAEVSETMRTIFNVLWERI